MKNYCQKFQILGLLIVVILLSACKFPDSNMDWQDIKGYKLDKLKFGTTTVSDFVKLAPDAKAQKLDLGIIIFNTEPANKDVYKRIRVGFRNDKLDWLEFTFNEQVKMSEMLDLYGKPRNINEKYSKIVDYYDYDFFNITTDKSHNLAKSINIFEIRKHTNTEIALINGIPDLSSLMKVKFLDLEPGISLEADFKNNFPDVEAYRKDESSSVAIYTLDSELGKAKKHYKKALIVFDNGLLSWINIIPQDLSKEKALNLYGSKYKIEPVNAQYDFYDYKDFVLVVDKKQNKVKNIGIISASQGINKLKP
ncbi:MAG: hypothetical protein ACD_20C00096G0001 [uncultured bacterium]|nr:MAG: hypothetical protein ACD_20C00096G0001 [uncultured bacterium]HBH18414.1 hypothetical protein [Cyanobacteria bacterium UBA9579]